MTFTKLPCKAVILDFDGTIADSFDIFIEAIEAVLKRKQRLTNAEIARLRKSSIKEIIAKIGIKRWQVPRLVIKGRIEINSRMDRVQAFEGMPEALKALAEDHVLYIVSTNSEDNILHFLKTYDMLESVSMIYANVGLTSKARSLKKLLNKEGLAHEDCLYIGDETRDIEAARKAGIRCIGVSWGFSNPSTLEGCHPDALAHRPADLVKIIGTSNRG